MRLPNKRYEFSIFEIISVILLLAVIFWECVKKSL